MTMTSQQNASFPALNPLNGHETSMKQNNKGRAGGGGSGNMFLDRNKTILSLLVTDPSKASLVSESGSASLTAAPQTKPNMFLNSSSSPSLQNASIAASVGSTLQNNGKKYPTPAEQMAAAKLYQAKMLLAAKNRAQGQKVGGLTSSATSNMRASLLNSRRTQSSIALGGRMSGSNQLMSSTLASSSGAASNATFSSSATQDLLLAAKKRQAANILLQKSTSSSSFRRKKNNSQNSLGVIPEPNQAVDSSSQQQNASFLVGSSSTPDLMSAKARQGKALLRGKKNSKSSAGATTASASVSVASTSSRRSLKKSNSLNSLNSIDELNPSEHGTTSSSKSLVRTGSKKKLTKSRSATDIISSTGTKSESKKGLSRSSSSKSLRSTASKKKKSTTTESSATKKVSKKKSSSDTNGGGGLKRTSSCPILDDQGKSRDRNNNFTSYQEFAHIINGDHVPDEELSNSVRSFAKDFMDDESYKKAIGENDDDDDDDDANDFDNDDDDGKASVGEESLGACSIEFEDMPDDDNDKQELAFDEVSELSGTSLDAVDLLSTSGPPTRMRGKKPKDLSKSNDNPTKSKPIIQIDHKQWFEQQQQEKERSLYRQGSFRSRGSNTMPRSSQSVGCLPMFERPGVELERIEKLWRQSQRELMNEENMDRPLFRVSSDNDIMRNRRALLGLTKGGGGGQKLKYMPASLVKPR